MFYIYFCVTFCIKSEVRTCFCLQVPECSGVTCYKAMFLSPNCRCIFLKYQLTQSKPKKGNKKDESRNK